MFLYTRIIEDYNLSCANILEAVSYPMVIIDRNQCFVYINQAMASASGCNVNDLLGKQIKAMDANGNDMIWNRFNTSDYILKEPEFELEFAGSTYIATIKPLTNPTGEVFLLISMQNISKYKRVMIDLEKANEELTSFSQRDGLTGVLNPKTYCEVCNRIISIAVRKDDPFAVLFIDIDYFKKVNDNFGHRIGDEVLIQLANCLSIHCRKSDVIARVGGEEFSIFLPNTNQEGANALAEKLREKVERLNPCIEGVSVPITISIGIATNRVGIQSIVELQKQADTAMYQAKKKGRNCVSIF